MSSNPVMNSPLRSCPWSGIVPCALLLLSVPILLLGQSINVNREWETQTLRGNLALRENDLYAAKDAYVRALALSSRFHPDDLRTATSLYNWGQLQVYLGHYDQADSLYRQALLVSTHSLGGEHPYHHQIRAAREAITTAREKSARYAPRLLWPLTRWDRLFNWLAVSRDKAIWSATSFIPVTPLGENVFYSGYRLAFRLRVPVYANGPMVATVVHERSQVDLPGRRPALDRRYTGRATMNGMGLSLGIWHLEALAGTISRRDDPLAVSLTLRRAFLHKFIRNPERPHFLLHVSMSLLLISAPNATPAMLLGPGLAIGYKW